MKYSFCIFFISLSFWLLTGCKKDSPAPGARIIPIQENLSPNTYAGGDLFVWPPLNEAILSGSYYNARNNIKKVTWTKIGGPDSYLLENRDSLSTKVSGLEAGVYQFELTISDQMNFTDRDIVTVYVGELSTNPKEIIFKDLDWTSISPWCPGLEIKNFGINVAPGSAFKIFIQRDNGSTWSEVPPTNQVSLPTNGLYDYKISSIPEDSFDDNSLYLFNYGNNTSDTPNVKIVY